MGLIEVLVDGFKQMGTTSVSKGRVYKAPSVSEAIKMFEKENPGCKLKSTLEIGKQNSRKHY